MTGAQQAKREASEKTGMSGTVLTERGYPARRTASARAVCVRRELSLRYGKRPLRES